MVARADSGGAAVIEELERLIEAARKRIAESPKYVPLTEAEKRELFGG